MAEQPGTGYQCKACGAAVVVLTQGDRSVIVRTCRCEGPVIASMDVGLTGASVMGA